MKWILVAVMVFATVLSDLLQSHEMKRAGEQSVSARGLTRLLHVIAHRRLLILGIACNAISFFRLYGFGASRAAEFRGARVGGEFCAGDAAGQVRIARADRYAQSGGSSRRIWRAWCWWADRTVPTEPRPKEAVTSGSAKPP